MPPQARLLGWVHHLVTAAASNSRTPHPKSGTSINPTLPFEDPGPCGWGWLMRGATGGGCSAASDEAANGCYQKLRVGRGGVDCGVLVEAARPFLQRLGHDFHPDDLILAEPEVPPSETEGGEGVGGRAFGAEGWTVVLRQHAEAGRALVSLMEALLPSFRAYTRTRLNSSTP